MSDYFVRNASALREWSATTTPAPLQLPLGRFASSGGVARTLGKLNDRQVKNAYRTTVEARDEIDASTQRALETRDGLELGRRALAYVAARRDLAAPERLAEDARPLASERAQTLPAHLRLDASKSIQEGRTDAYADMLSEQRRGFFGRLFNRPLGIAAVDVVDGDSVRLNGKAEARLNGIDAPEMPGEAGRAARDHLRRLANAGALSVRDHGQDPYGRHLVTLYADGANLNRRMVGDGYARAYTRYSNKYWATQAGAALAGKGLWKDGWLKHPEKDRHAKADRTR